MLVCSDTQLCLILCNTVDSSTPSSSVHGALQARILKPVAISSRGSSPPRNQTCVSDIGLAGRFFSTSAPWEAYTHTHTHTQTYLYLKKSFLENPIGRGAWRATVHVVARVRHDLVAEPPPSTYKIYFIHESRLSVNT